MAFGVRTEGRGPAGEHEVVVLESHDGSEIAEICPALGFNCYRWAVGGTELLYADPVFFAGGSPTRSGIPILFPFPNRIRDGRYSWQGRSYHLPRNDPAGKNAIHGFTPRKPWRVLNSGADHSSAWVTAEFQGSVDAPETCELWPADYRIRVTHRLESRRLRTNAVVANPDTRPLPFGLGYHHYFALGGQETWITVPAAARWELIDNLPTGKKQPSEPRWDVNAPRRYAGLQLDDVLTELPERAEADGLCPRGTVRLVPEGRELHIRAAPAFRELVAFTPPHRRALCLEPYTCVTDAINLQQAGIDAGLMVLASGEDWRAAVEVQVT